MGRLLLLLLLIPAQDPTEDDLLRELGDSDPAIRDRATDTLEGKGSAAIETLKRAARDPDLEIRSRAGEILRRLEPSLFLDDLLKSERARKFPAPPKLHPSWANATVIDGGWFSFERKLWVSKGVLQGQVLTTLLGGRSNCEFQWTIASVLAGCNVAVERCADHSPRLVYLSADCSDSVVVRIEGIRSWTCEVPVTFRLPINGAQRRVGPFRLTVDWPYIEVTSETPVRADLISAALIPAEISCLFKPGRRAGPPARILGTPDDEPAIFFPEAVERAQAWCG